jgi:hypothetical protein
MVPALREVQLVVQAEFVYTPTLTAETVPCTGTFWLADRMAEVATVRIMPMDAANAIAMIRLLCNAIVQPLNVLNRTTQLLINVADYKYYTNTNPKNTRRLYISNPAPTSAPIGAATMIPTSTPSPTSISNLIGNT